MTAISPESKEALGRYEKSLDCVHCGLCLSVCPTYKETVNEALSPRGRIYLMRGLVEGGLTLNESFAEKMDHCLVCRACETICPSGVEFGRMMEITRHEMHRSGVGTSMLGRRFRAFLFNRIIPHRGRLSFVASLARSWKSGLFGRVMRALGARALMPRTLRIMEEAIPEIPPRAERKRMPTIIPARADVPRRGTVAILLGCVMDQVFGAVNRRLADALAYQGYDVLVPEAQTCCGALHAHAGDLDQARTLAVKNIEAFQIVSPEWIVLDSAGCGAMMREYDTLFAEDDPMKAKAAAFSKKVIDVLELFEKEKLAPRGRDGTPIRAVYDAPCHLHHAQKCRTQPLDVLGRTKGIELVPLPGAEDCCGAAGIYNITHPDVSRALLEKKLDQLEKTGAKLLLTGNPGCMLQWQKGIAARGLDVRVAHPVEVL